MRGSIVGEHAHAFSEMVRLTILLRHTFSQVEKDGNRKRTNVRAACSPGRRIKRVADQVPESARFIRVGRCRRCPVGEKEREEKEKEKEKRIEITLEGAEASYQKSLAKAVHQAVQ